MMRGIDRTYPLHLDPGVDSGRSTQPTQPTLRHITNSPLNNLVRDGGLRAQISHVPVERPLPAVPTAAARLNHALPVGFQLPAAPSRVVYPAWSLTTIGRTALAIAELSAIDQGIGQMVGAGLAVGDALLSYNSLRTAFTEVQKHHLQVSEAQHAAIAFDRASANAEALRHAPLASEAEKAKAQEGAEKALQEYNQACAKLGRALNFKDERIAKAFAFCRDSLLQTATNGMSIAKYSGYTTAGVTATSALPDALQIIPILGVVQNGLNIAQSFVEGWDAVQYGKFITTVKTKTNVATSKLVQAYAGNPAAQGIAKAILTGSERTRQQSRIDNNLALCKAGQRLILNSVSLAFNACGIATGGATWATAAALGSSSAYLAALSKLIFNASSNEDKKSNKIALQSTRQKVLDEYRQNHHAGLTSTQQTHVQRALPIEAVKGLMGLIRNPATQAPAMQYLRELAVPKHVIKQVELASAPEASEKRQTAAQAVLQHYLCGAGIMEAGLHEEALNHLSENNGILRRSEEDKLRKYQAVCFLAAEFPTHIESIDKAACGKLKISDLRVILGLPKTPSWFQATGSDKEKRDLSLYESGEEAKSLYKLSRAYEGTRGTMSARPQAFRSLFEGATRDKIRALLASPLYPDSVKTLAVSYLVGKPRSNGPEKPDSEPITANADTYLEKHLKDITPINAANFARLLRFYDKSRTKPLSELIKPAYRFKPLLKNNRVISDSIRCVVEEALRERLNLARPSSPEKNNKLVKLVFEVADLEANTLSSLYNKKLEKVVKLVEDVMQFPDDEEDFLSKADAAAAFNGVSAGSPLEQRWPHIEKQFTRLEHGLRRPFHIRAAHMPEDDYKVAWEQKLAEAKPSPAGFSDKNISAVRELLLDGGKFAHQLQAELNKSLPAGESIPNLEELAQFLRNLSKSGGPENRSNFPSMDSIVRLYLTGEDNRLVWSDDARQALERFHRTSDDTKFVETLYNLRYESIFPGLSIEEKFEAQDRSESFSKKIDEMTLLDMRMAMGSKDKVKRAVANYFCKQYGLPEYTRTTNFSLQSLWRNSIVAPRLAATLVPLTDIISKELTKEDANNPNSRYRELLDQFRKDFSIAEKWIKAEDIVRLVLAHTPADKHAQITKTIEHFFGNSGALHSANHHFVHGVWHAALRNNPSSSAPGLDATNAAKGGNDVNARTNVDAPIVSNEDIILIDSDPVSVVSSVQTQTVPRHISVVS